MKCSGIALLLLAFAATSPAVAADAHHHHHDEAPTKLALDHGRKWATDAPLRQAMTTLRAALAGKLRDIHKGTLSKDDQAALGAGIDQQIEVMVSQCKLTPKADAMLHIVIAELAAAAEVMQGKAAGDGARAAHRAAMALNDYGRYFNHPGWRALK